MSVIVMLKLGQLKPLNILGVSPMMWNRYIILKISKTSIRKKNNYLSSGNNHTSNYGGGIGSLGGSEKLYFTSVTIH